jgi:perosamine synthetase
VIPVCEPLLSGRETEYVLDCLKTNWISSQGRYVEEFENRFAAYCGCRYGISTTSGTTALHLALAAIGVGPGHRVIIPAFTMISTAFAVLYTGAEPVLVDSEPGTWNIDVGAIEGKITPETRAIMPVHIYGHPCDMDPIMGIAENRGLCVIEDAAEAHGAEYKGSRVGGLGHVSCFSFYANKIITTGEGGMVVTNDPSIAERARRLKDLGHSRQRRFLHADIGFNYRMTNVQAAIGLAQLENIDSFIDARRRNARLYRSGLEGVPGVVLPPEKDWAKNVYWMYSVLITEEFGMARDDLMAELAKKGIETRALFIPMHLQPALLARGLFAGETYPVAEELGERGLYLPSGSGLEEEQIDFVCKAVQEISRRTGRRSPASMQTSEDHC